MREIFEMRNLKKAGICTAVVAGVAGIFAVAASKMKKNSFKKGYVKALEEDTDLFSETIQTMTEISNNNLKLSEKYRKLCEDYAQLEEEYAELCDICDEKIYD